MARFSYTPRGVCSRRIEFDLEDGIVKNVQFTMGCHGNTQGVATLVDGMRADDVVKKLRGINCSGRGTSCPDQLAIAIENAMNE